ncbi:alpha-amylase family glycosyl hydrolase [Curtobacterium flaccumfaciens]|nr:alpha-amylase family glycosyl hydrolase [Curtobacterium flaccumfaciens]
MVRLLHEAGIQVVLDVVYNHTAEEGAAARPPRCGGWTARTGTGGPPTATRTTTPRGAEHARHLGRGDGGPHRGQPRPLGTGRAGRRVPLRPHGSPRP